MVFLFFFNVVNVKLYAIFLYFCCIMHFIGSNSHFITCMRFTHFRYFTQFVISTRPLNINLNYINLVGNHGGLAPLSLYPLAASVTYIYIEYFPENLYVLVLSFSTSTNFVFFVLYNLMKLTSYLPTDIIVTSRRKT